MSLLVSEKSTFIPAPSGLHAAICTQVIDLGVQVTPYGSRQQVLIVWEMPNALMEDVRPFSISRRFASSLSKKSALREILESWRGHPFSKEEAAAFDLGSLLGKPCQALIQHVEGQDGRIFANVHSIVPSPKGTVLTAQNELLRFDMDNPDENIKNKLSEWVRKLIDAALPPPRQLPRQR